MHLLLSTLYDHAPAVKYPVPSCTIMHLLLSTLYHHAPALKYPAPSCTCCKEDFHFMTVELFLTLLVFLQLQVSRSPAGDWNYGKIDQKPDKLCINVYFFYIYYS